MKKPVHTGHDDDGPDSPTRSLVRKEALRPAPTLGYDWDTLARHMLSIEALLGGGRHRDGHAGLGVRQRDEARDVPNGLAVDRELARELALVRLDTGPEDGREVVRRELPEQAVERGVARRLAVVAAVLAVEARQAECDALPLRELPAVLEIGLRSLCPAITPMASSVSIAPRWNTRLLPRGSRTRQSASCRDPTSGPSSGRTP